MPTDALMRIHEQKALIPGLRAGSRCASNRFRRSCTVHKVPANHRSTALLFLICLAVLFAPNGGRAQPFDVPATWGGDILSRPRLAGDWDGLRDELGKKGVVFDVDLELTPQVVTSGGVSTGGDFWGNLFYTVKLDTQKLGLWPGGFINFQAETGFGSNAFRDSGAIVPITHRRPAARE